MNNPEKTLKSTVKILYVLLNIAFIISFVFYCIVVGGLTYGSDFYDVGEATLVFVPSFFLGIIFTFIPIAINTIAFLWLLTYLDLVELTRETADSVKEIKQKLNMDNPTAAAGSNAATDSNANA